GNHAQRGVSGTVAGAFYFDLRPAPADVARLLCGAAPFVAPGLVMTSGAAGLAGSACAFDGRLDEELGPQSPAQHALKLYEARGVAGLHDLVGDWSLAIWD